RFAQTRRSSARLCDSTRRASASTSATAGSCRTCCGSWRRRKGSAAAVETGEELRSLLGRFPSGVAVVTVPSGGQRVGLTVGTLVGLSLEPPLVGFSVARQAALHEVLREGGTARGP